MKKAISLILTVVMLILLSVTPGFAKGGVYSGSGDSQMGGAGSIGVEVTLDDQGVITSISIVKNNDSPGVSDPAVEKLPAAMIASQSVAVDAVSGATMTSNAIIAAVTDALKTAGVDMAKYTEKKEAAPIEKADDMDLTADVVVIGGGGAGLAAAVQANQNGATVIVLEKMSKVGGNTILSGGAFNAVNDRSETAIANNDSVEWHYTQTINGGNNQGDPVLVHTLVEKGWAGVEWLKELGMEFKEGTFTVTGGLWPRANKPVEPLGTGFFKTYNAYIASHEGVEVLLNTKAEEILVDELGMVCGVLAKGETGNTITVKAKSVVVATGGFSNSIALRQAYNIQWADLGDSIKSTNHPGATGDAIKMLMKLRVDFIQMGNIQLLPLGDPNTGSLSGNIEHDVETRIFVNKEGNRFVNEGGRRDDMTKALFQQTDNLMWIIMDSDTYPTGDEKNNFNETANELVAAGRAFKADTLEALAEMIGVSAENLVATVEDFNAHAASREADQFGRTLYSTPIDNGPFYAAARVPTVHHTMGGVRINQYAQVIDENGKIIPHLYAAGEVTGGIHGANRLGGNALLDTVVFGRIAGESAAACR